MKATRFWLSLVISASLATPAMAGGYDTPILYSARHMGMGGTAIGYVNDASAVFHNPAGLSQTPFVSILGDLSLLIGGITASPDAAAISVESETAVPPAFLIGGSIRPLMGILGDDDFLAIGIGAYPVAAASAAYTYESNGTAKVDSTSLLFLEISPAFSLHIPDSLKTDGLHHLSIGFGYRVTYVSLDRKKGNADDPRALTFAPSGFNFEGWRAGLQYAPIPELEIGVTYRHKTTTVVEADSGFALFPVFPEFTRVETEFVLPSKLGVGVRGNLGPVSLAADLEYAWQSQNQGAPLIGTHAGGEETVGNIFKWTDAMTIRVGAEYRIPHSDEVDAPIWSVRAGYIFDDKVANKAYPSAFGTPPAPTHSGTIGLGFDAGDWQANFAYALRTGGTTVEKTDLATDCIACGKEGDYSILLHGIYLDFSYDFHL